MPERTRGCAWHPLPVRVQEPVHVAVTRVRPTRRQRLRDPGIREDPLRAPDAAALLEQAEARHIPGVDVHPAAPVPGEVPVEPAVGDGRAAAVVAHPAAVRSCI